MTEQKEMEKIDLLKSCLSEEQFVGYCMARAIGKLIDNNAEDALWYCTFATGQDPREGNDGD